MLRLVVPETHTELLFFSDTIRSPHFPFFCVRASCFIKAPLGVRLRLRRRRPACGPPPAGMRGPAPTAPPVIGSEAVAVRQIAPSWRSSCFTSHRPSNRRRRRQAPDPGLCELHFLTGPPSGAGCPDHGLLVPDHPHRARSSDGPFDRPARAPAGSVRRGPGRAVPRRPRRPGRVAP